MKFKKSRQLIMVTEKDYKEFIEVPGYLYHYKRFGQDLFIHHKLDYNAPMETYRMLDTWQVSEPRTGLSIDTKIACITRMETVEAVNNRLLEVSSSHYYEAVLLGLANMPEHVASWRIDSPGLYAVRVRKNDS